MAATVARVRNLSSKDIKECIRKSAPMIATDMMKSWKASTLWSFDFVKEHYGSDVVALSDGRFRALVQLPLAHCIDLILGMNMGDTYKYSGATPYIQDWVALDMHPELNEDIEVPRRTNLSAVGLNSSLTARQRRRNYCRFHRGTKCKSSWD